jgi:hypothetical protein
MWRIAHVQTEDDWTRELLATVLATPAPELPAASQFIGNSVASWFETEPGIAMIMTRGGSVDDRVLAEAILRHDLATIGYKQAKFTFDHFVKTADWNDIMAKAKRLVQSGNVQLLRNGYNSIVGHVIGDHGEYTNEISRDDPSSRAITQWTCECPWDQYAWQRTRQWKKYEGRPCAHVLATYWTALGTPLDEDRAPPSPQMRLFSPPTVPFAPKMPTGPSAPSGPPGGGQMQMFGPTDPASLGQPAPSQTLPPIPTEQEIPPVSVPGMQQPSPLNPVQYPGGTYSSTIMSANQYNNGDIVQLKVDTMGQAEGRSVEHGSGQWVNIPKNSIGEVLAQDTTTGWVEAIFTGPAAQNREMEPYHVRAFFEPSELIPRPDIPKPGPAIRRTRG